MRDPTGEPATWTTLTPTIVHEQRLPDEEGWVRCVTALCVRPDGPNPSADRLAALVTAATRRRWSARTELVLARWVLDRRLSPWEEAGEVDGAGEADRWLLAGGFERCAAALRADGRPVGRPHVVRALERHPGLEDGGWEGRLVAAGCRAHGIGPGDIVLALLPPGPTPRATRLAARRWLRAGFVLIEEEATPESPGPIVMALDPC